MGVYTGIDPQVKLNCAIAAYLPTCLFLFFAVVTWKGWTMSRAACISLPRRAAIRRTAARMLVKSRSLCRSPTTLRSTYGDGNQTETNVPRLAFWRPGHLEARGYDSCSSLKCAAIFTQYSPIVSPPEIVPSAPHTPKLGGLPAP
jgi:hypothetical protein